MLLDKIPGQERTRKKAPDGETIAIDGGVAAASLSVKRR